MRLREMICRDFPSEEEGDCYQEGFCEGWRKARYDMILAAVTGGFALFYSVVLLLCGKVHNEHAWKFLFGLILIHCKFVFFFSFLM